MFGKQDSAANCILMLVCVTEIWSIYNAIPHIGHDKAQSWLGYSKPVCQLLLKCLCRKEFKSFSNLEVDSNCLVSVGLKLCSLTQQHRQVKQFLLLHTRTTDVSIYLFTLEIWNWFFLCDIKQPDLILDNKVNVESPHSLHTRSVLDSLELKHWNIQAVWIVWLLLTWSE